MCSIETLSKSLLPLSSRPKRHHDALATLADFTGYLTSETYSLSNRLRTSVPGVKPLMSVEEEDIRKEIRALKGLVLNRSVSLIQ